ncbi:HD domain-containing protein [Candidatus Bathyarchaeota archaeon]|nr:HD domain-containing protein [Candidatus Bathyarchaeota archaeon]
MMFDRIYGRLYFPSIIREVLNCPGLLRLREVHMSSIPFMSFPSFSSVNRFEHSLGVCHLARLASDALGLSNTDRIELMCASLYHDVSTPPFAHVTEELMDEFYGFDHEENLRSLLVGKTEDLGMEKVQVYKGRGLKLLKVIQGEEGRKLGLDIFRIADMATGKGKFGPLVKGEIDLDNIDNVIRAATAMGIKSAGGHDAEALSRTLSVSNSGISLHGDSMAYLGKWQHTRYTLYDMIYGAVEDFSLQTMLKSAIRLLLNAEDERKFLRLDWRLTDEELVRDRIMNDENARKIWDRILLCRPCPCIGIFSLSGLKSHYFVKKNINAIEDMASDVLGIRPIANFTLDKRYRSLTYPLRTFLGKEEKRSEGERTENTFLFLFSPEKASHQHDLYHELVLKLKSIVPNDINP